MDDHDIDCPAVEHPNAVVRTPLHELQRKARGTEREPDGRWSDPKHHLARAVLFAIQFPSEPIPLPDLGSACGFDVFLTFGGTARGVLFFDRNGNLIREVEAGGVLKVSLTSSSQSLTFPLAALHTTYQGDDDGNVTVGSTAVVTVTGFSLSPFVRTSGKAVFNAVVIEISGEGVPVTDFIGPPIFFAGHTGEVQAICEALT